MERSPGSVDEGSDPKPRLVPCYLPLVWASEAPAKRYLQGIISFDKQDKVFEALTV